MTLKGKSSATKVNTSIPAQSRKLPIAHSLLARAHSPDTASQIHVDSVQRRPLFLRPTNKDDLSVDARAARQRVRVAKEAEKTRSNRRPRPISAAQKRKLGLYTLSKEQQKWDNFVGLNRLWNGYIREVLGWKGKTRLEYLDSKSIGSTITSADLHGAMVEVVKSRCVGRVGIRGIIVKDTRETLNVITKKNELKMVPKEYTVFRIEIPLEVVDESTAPSSADDASPFVAIEIQGSQFAHRPVERATRKLKLHLPPDI